MRVVDKVLESVLAVGVVVVDVSVVGVVVSDDGVVGGVTTGGVLVVSVAGGVLVSVLGVLASGVADCAKAIERGEAMKLVMKTKTRTLLKTEELKNLYKFIKFSYS